MSETQKSGAQGKTYEGFTPEERAAMKDRAQERKAAARRPRGAPVDEGADVLAKIAEMSESDRLMAERVHAVITASVPTLTARLWYGMPAYALDGKVLCFFQPAQKFKSRYATLGFNDVADLDDGAIWPVAFAVTEINADVEARIVALVERAAG